MRRSPPGPQRPVCRALVAAAGYGKTTALRQWHPPDTSRWFRAADGPAHRLVAEAVAAGDHAIVVDDLPRVPAEQVRAVVEAVGEAVGELADPVTVVLCSRWPIAAPALRWLGRGLWKELGPADLALTPEQVADLLLDEYGLSGPDLAERVHGATGGWPALVHLCAQTLRLDGVPAGLLAAAVTRQGGLLASYLAEEVLPAVPPDGIRLLRDLGDLAPVTVGLCRALGHREADDLVELLRRTGVLTRTPGSALETEAPEREHHVVPVVAAVAGRADPPPPAARVATAAAAAAWYDRHGPAVAAARAFRRAGDHGQCARVLEEHGEEMIAAGHGPAVAELVAALPGHVRTRAHQLLLGDAQRTAGDLVAAGRTYDAVAAAGSGPDAGLDSSPDAGLDSSLDAGLAWRMGRLHYQRGDARAALDTFARGRHRPAPTADRALLLAWTAHAHLLSGEVDAAVAHARRAVSVAVDSGHAGALATAYLSVALCLGVSGDAAGSEEHYALALPIAERGRDVLLLARIHTNRTYQLLRTARYADALAMAQRSARYAALAGSPSLRAIATCNEADALAMLGRYDEAIRRYETALAHYQRGGSRRFAGALLGLGELYRRRGWRERSRAAYEEAIRVTTDTANAHVLVAAQAGLAMVLIDDEPKDAAAHAEQAVRHAPPGTGLPALLARGWLAWHAADPGGAAELAAQAAGVARAQQDRAGLADALELRAAAERDPARVREALREAHGIWAAAGAAIEAARLQVILARLPGAGTDDRLDALLAVDVLASAGAAVDRVPGTPGFPSAAADHVAGGTVAIRALGQFEVQLDGRAVPASQWQSRKARDLLRILVARRGRPAPRGELCELLWPDDDPTRTGHRLSVLLSIVRNVLDPTKAYATDHFLVADQASIALDTAQVRVDVEDFLIQVTHGRRLVERGALDDGGAMLAAADRQFRADVFEDEPYADWAVPLREEVRAAYLTMLRTLARTSRAGGDLAAAVGYLLRLLERDPYDEPAHRALVRTLVAGGQHGEARRALARYRDAMRAIGVRPPDGALLVPVRPAR